MTEGDIALDLRARRFAALGEPARLAIADRLLLGDVSPGALGDLVGAATNLLAHHLNALEETGLVRRLRSEGDKRRTYVTLRPDAATVAALSAALAARGGVRRPRRLVLAGTGDAARTQLAASLWLAASPVPVVTGGVRPAARIHPRTTAAVRRHGLRLASARTRPLAVEPGDLVVAVSDGAAERLARDGTPPALHWSVPDPAAADTDEAFETALDDLGRRVSRLAAAMA